MLEYKNFLEGYKERVARITLFDLFNSIEKKQGKDNEGNPIDYFGFYLLSLLFFFENMLRRNQVTGVKELSLFLKETSKEHIILEDAGFMEVARSLIEVMRPPSGKRNRREFYNYETREMDFVEYSILKVTGWDKENNYQYYALDEQGLELIFATKEYFSEFQISINQLILRKQLEKGEFSGALRQIDEMRINVNSIKDKIVNIKHEVQRNIVSDETYERYKDLIEDINMRLSREHEEFEEIATFVHETKLYYEKDIDHQNKDQKAFALIIKIDNELNEVHNFHSSLLRESIELKTTALKSVRDSLYYVGLTSFNFDQEIVRKVMTRPKPLMDTRVFASPFLGLKKAKIWSPMSLFATQRILGGTEDINQHEFFDASDVAISRDLIMDQRIFESVFRMIWPFIKENEGIELKTLINHVDKRLINIREFYDLFIILHQLSPLAIHDVIQQKEHIFSKAFEEIVSEYEFIKVVECEGELEIMDNYYVRNMVLSLTKNIVKEEV
jgi:hypothetical protein